MAIRVIGMLSMPFIFISYSHKDSEYANRPAESEETNVRLAQIEMDQVEPARPDPRIPDKPLRLELVCGSAIVTLRSIPST